MERLGRATAYLTNTAGVAFSDAVMTTADDQTLFDPQHVANISDWMKQPLKTSKLR